MGREFSTRYLAWNYLTTYLAAISTVDSAYWNTVASVSDQPPDMDATTGGPWLVVSFGSEEIERASVGGTYDCTQTVTIDAYIVRSTTRATNVQNACRLLQDIRRCVIENEAAIVALVKGLHSLEVSSTDSDDGWLEFSGGLIKFSQPVLMNYKTRSAW